MKSFFVICFLGIFTVVVADKEINWSEVRSKILNISSIIKFPVDKGIVQEKIVPHSFPYHVGLLFETAKGRFWCGGSLITREYVLTAAHCPQKMEEVIVFLGSHNRSEQTDGELRIKVPKTNFIMHEKYGSVFVSNDIALIKLPNPIKLTKNIQLLHLPPRSLPNLEGKLLTATGWGDTWDKPSQGSNVLRYVEIKVIPEEECRKYYIFFIDDTHVCTRGIDGKTPCSGDSGGPMVIKESDGSITIVGLVSFGSSKGCELGWPVVYTRITSYLDWISSHTGLKIKV